jgi:hypothetical protein
MTELRPCERCNGTKTTTRKAFTYTDHRTGKQTHYPDKTEPCYKCAGAGQFAAPDETAIFAKIKGRKGLRSARPAREAGSDRAYYVWRMARFHGGVDMTMPVMASLEIGGDPWRKELDELADKAARQFLGSDMRAAMRWGRALGVF